MSRRHLITLSRVACVSTHQTGIGAAAMRCRATGVTDGMEAAATA